MSSLSNARNLTQTLSTPCIPAAAAAIGNKVVFAGGNNAAGSLSDIFCLNVDSATNITLCSLPPLMQARHNVASSVVGDEVRSFFLFLVLS